MLLTLAEASRGPSLRTQRLRLTWPLALPFLLLARPTPGTFLLGLIISVSGTLLRAFAAGSIEKDRQLASGGPYAFLRHPLYLGSFLAGLGFSLAGGRWFFFVGFLALFLWVYRRTITAEERDLERLFGRDYQSYRDSVPAFFPRIHVPRTQGGSPGFRLELYWRNKEWQAAVGVLSGYLLLWVRMSVVR